MNIRLSENFAHPKEIKSLPGRLNGFIEIFGSYRQCLEDLDKF